MLNKRFRARVKLPIGTTEIVIEADSLFNARQMLQAQYGQDAVLQLVEMLTQ